MRGLHHNLLLPSKQAFLFMQDFAAGDKPSRLKAITGTPVKTTIAYTYGDREFHGDLYMPVEPPKAGMVLVPGVSKDGKDDPRLATFANTVARNGFAILVPELSSVRGLKVMPELAQDVVAAFSHLASRPDLAPGGRAGIGGLSFAIGPGIIAALDPAIRDQVRYLFCIGGYYDLFETVVYVTTSHFRIAGGSWQRLESDHYGMWVLALSLSVYITNADTRALFSEMAARRVPDAEADLSDLEAQLSDPEGQALYALVMNRDPERTAALYAALPSLMREKFEGLNFARLGLHALKARLILVHGYEDTLIPYSESLALYRAAPAGRKRLYLVHGLSHVTMKKPGLVDAWALLSSVTALLREQETKPGT